MQSFVVLRCIKNALTDNNNNNQSSVLGHAFRVQKNLKSSSEFVVRLMRSVKCGSV